MLSGSNAGLAKAKVYPRPFASPVSTYVFGNKFAIILWSEFEPLGIIVDSKEIADANRKYFGVMWKVAKNY